MKTSEIFMPTLEVKQDRQQSSQESVGSSNHIVAKSKKRERNVYTSSVPMSKVTEPPQQEAQTPKVALGAPEPKRTKFMSAGNMVYLALKPYHDMPGDTLYTAMDKLSQEHMKLWFSHASKSKRLRFLLYHTPYEGKDAFLNWARQKGEDMSFAHI